MVSLGTIPVFFLDLRWCSACPRLKSGWVYWELLLSVVLCPVLPADLCSRQGSLNGSEYGCGGALIFQGSIWSKGELQLVGLIMLGWKLEPLLQCHVSCTAICHWGNNLHSKGQLAGLRLALPGRLFFFLYLPVCVIQSSYLWVRQRVGVVLIVWAINFKKSQEE